MLHARRFAGHSWDDKWALILMAKQRNLIPFCLPSTWNTKLYLFHISFIIYSCKWCFFWQNNFCPQVPYKAHGFRYIWLLPRPIYPKFLSLVSKFMRDVILNFELKLGELEMFSKPKCPKTSGQKWSRNELNKIWKIPKITSAPINTCVN